MSLLAPILVLGLVILVHEAGHFWAAKFFGVYAPRFAIGFGPTLWRRKWGETEYVIGALPLGGYVRMATRDDEATTALEGQLDESKGGKQEPLDPNAMIPFGPKPVPPERWFESKPLWQRAIILLAGVTMNVILGLVVMIASVMLFYRASASSVVAQVIPGRPAAAAGIVVGDSVVAVDSTRVGSWNEMVGLISSAPGREITLQVMRGGALVAARMTTEVDSVPDLSGTWVKVGRIGIGQDTSNRKGLSPGAAIALGTRATWRMATSVVNVLGGLVTGRISITNLGGPVAIVRASVGAARSGAEDLLFLIALLSVNLAVLNLVPIPLLDGGQLVLQSAETARGRPFSDTQREWIARVGLALIATLFLVVTFNDLKALVLSWMK